MGGRNEIPTIRPILACVLVMGKEKEMRTIKTTTVTETRERKELVSQTCDICGREAGRKPLWGETIYRFDNTTVEIKRREGSSYPEGGMGTEVVIDICPECFVKKLVPWVESFGLTKIQEQEWDW